MQKNLLVFVAAKFSGHSQGCFRVTCHIIKPGFHDKYLPVSEREVVKPFVAKEQPLPGLMKIKFFPEISIIHLVSRCG